MIELFQFISFYYQLAYNVQRIVTFSFASSNLSLLSLFLKSVFKFAKYFFGAFLYELLFLSLTIEKLSLLLLNKSTIFEILGNSMTSTSSSIHSFDTFINSSSILSLYNDLFLRAFCKSYLVSAGRTEL